MTPQIKSNVDLHVDGFVVKFFKLVDILPHVKRKGPISGTTRLINTVIGLILLLMFQLCPYFGLYFISRPTQLRLLFSSSTNPTELARSSVITAPLIFNAVRAMFNPKGFDKDKKSLIRGVRNWSILVGAVIRAPYVLIAHQLGQEAILLYPPQLLKLVVFIYVIQNIIFSIAVIWIEEFLEDFGIRGYNAMIYYQLMELFVQIKISATPGDFNYLKVLTIVIVLVLVQLQDYFLTEEIEYAHSQNVKNTRVMKYHPSALVSTISLIHSMIKHAVDNFIGLIYNPGIELLEYLIGTDLSNLKVPYWITRDMFFREDYHYFYYIEKTSLLAGSILISLCLDLLLYIYVGTKIEKLDPQYDSEYLNMELKRAGNQVSPVCGVLNPLKEKLSRLKVSSIVTGAFFYILLSITPIYGSVLRGPQLVYYVGRVSQLPEILKTEEEIPTFLKEIKNKT